MKTAGTSLSAASLSPAGCQKRRTRNSNPGVLPNLYSNCSDSSYSVSGLKPLHQSNRQDSKQDSAPQRAEQGATRTGRDARSNTESGSYPLSSAALNQQKQAIKIGHLTLTGIKLGIKLGIKAQLMIKTEDAAYDPKHTFSSIETYETSNSAFLNL